MSSGPLSVPPPGDGRGAQGVRREGGSAPARPLARPDAGRGRRLRWLLPIGVLLASLAASFAIFATRPRVERAAPEVLPPLVRVVEATARSLELRVSAQGTVAPRTESDLVAEVRGRLVWVSPALVAGGFFAEGEELVRLDGREYAIAVERARATVELRESEAALATAEARRRRALAESGAASDADLDQFESRARVAAASLREARAALDQAALELERTVVRAPFSGRVRERHADLGQFVNPGSKLARIYAVDYAEVRLPIPTDDLAHLGLPLDFRAETAGQPGPEVTLTARLGGAEYRWPARLVRAEGEIDPRTRMLHVVARVDDPYGRSGEPDRPPLAAGLFVAAEIRGRSLSDVFQLPRGALRDGDRVLVVDGDERLRFRDVEVLRRDRRHVVIGAGLEAGERVCISPLQAVTDGMRVRSSLVSGS